MPVIVCSSKGGCGKTTSSAITLYAIAAIAYLLAYGVAVYERIPISDWLTSHLPL